MNPLITASIVAYHNSPEEIQQAAQSFLDSAIDSKKLIIIDHSQDDGLARIWDSYSDVEYEHHPENKGFGAGHNIAIRKIMEISDFHFIINPDVYFSKNEIPKMISYMQAHIEVGLLMPKIINPSGELQYLAKLLPTPFDLLFKRFLPASWTAKRMDRFQLKFTDYQQIMNVPYLSGSFMLMRTPLLKEIGLFDERFFMYPEDIDLSRRFHRKYKTIYFPDAVITHKHEASSYKSAKMLWIHLSNMFKYFNKWGWLIDQERKKMNNAVLSEWNHLQNSALK